MTRLLGLFLVLTLTAVANGDAGLVRGQTASDGLQMTVFTEPTPPRVGPVDVSVLLQVNGEVVTEGHVQATLTGPDGDALQIQLTRDDATTSFMQAAKIELPQSGKWRVRVTAEASQSNAHVEFTMDVADALPPLAAIWPWFLPVPLVLGLVALARIK
ncbi:MAG: hypothetical protein MK101_03660 [Phycisphaerales bacterium]|nr:hypothetical protein [Phycisphaerales bacterium]